MQDILFPMKFLRITQAYGAKTITHKLGFPVDNAGKDASVGDVLAPFDGVIKKIYPNGNSVWLESTSKVKAADGTVDYFTVVFTHDNDVSNLRVGQKIKQGNSFYQEGTNNAVGNHVHIEIGRGKFKSPGWYLKNGQWIINNPYKPEKAFLLKDVTILNTGGLSWKKEEVMEKTAYKYLIEGVLNRSVTPEDEKKHLGKDPNQVIIEVFKWAKKNKRTYNQALARAEKTVEQYRTALAKKPVEIIKEVPVEKIVYREVVKGDDERSMGDLLTAAFRKLHKVK